MQGAWAGKGVKARKSNRTFTRTIPGIAPAARKDFNRANVIISEKKDKKAAKYLQTDLPYPYTSAAQYEASFSNAVGSDWNTRATHQRETMPRVIKKVGFQGGILLLCAVSHSLLHSPEPSSIQSPGCFRRHGFGDGGCLQGAKSFSFSDACAERAHHVARLVSFLILSMQYRQSTTSHRYASRSRPSHLVLDYWVIKGRCTGCVRQGS